MKEKKLTNMDITKAEYVNNHIIRLFFSDGYCACYDFETYINLSGNPLVAKYADVCLFGTEWHIDNGVITWNNDMDFDPYALRYNKIAGVKRIFNE